MKVICVYFLIICLLSACSGLAVKDKVIDRYYLTAPDTDEQLSLSCQDSVPPKHAQAYKKLRLQVQASAWTGVGRMRLMMSKAGKTNGNNNDWQFWQQHNKPLEILNIEMFFQKLDYIHRNPVVSGFVENEEDWLYSSAGNFYGKKGMIELNYIV